MKANCILVQETHSINEDERFWSNQWGDKVILCHGTNKSAGVALLFHNFNGKIKNVNKDTNDHMCFGNQQQFINFREYLWIQFNNSK